MILLQQSSGLTVKEWCRDYGINDRTFYCRMKIVRKEELQRQSGGLIDTTNAYENKSNFQKLSFPSQNMPSPSITMSVSDVTLNSPITEAERGLDYCNKLFQLERELVDLTPQRRYEKRLELERPVWDAF